MQANTFVDKWLEQQSEPEILLWPESLPQSPVIDANMDPPTSLARQSSSQSLSQQSDGSKKLRSVQSPDYRLVLHVQSFIFDPLGFDIPDSLQELKRKIIATDSKPILSQQEIRIIQEQLSGVVSSDKEETRRILEGLSLFPTGISRASNLRLDRQALPYIGRGKPVCTPQPDVQYGYDPYSFTTEQLLVIQEGRLAQLARPSKACFFPYCFVEFKSASRGGTHYTAEIQNAGSGAHSVNTLKMLAEFASEPNSLHHIAFSCTIDSNYAAINMHWVKHENDKPRFVTSYIKSFCLKEEDGLQSFKQVFANIIKYGNGERLAEIKRLLNKISASHAEST